MKKNLIAIACFILPTFICRYLLWMFRIKTHVIGKGTRIGFSFVLCDEMKLGTNVKIGHLNFIHIILRIRKKPKNSIQNMLL